MFLQGLGNGLYFLIGLIFDFYIFVLLFRLILQKRFANYHNPVTQFVLKITNPPLIPLQKILPGVRGYDTAIIVLALFVTALEMLALFWLQYHITARAISLIVVVLGTLGEKVLNLYFFCVIIGVLLSWVPTLERSPMAEIIHLVIDPLMFRVRRWIPPIGGIDLTPIPVLIGIKLIDLMLLDPLIAWGLKLSLTIPK